jgi:hypothetical protein
MMDWWSFAQQVIANAVGTGIVGTLAASYFGERVRDAYQRVRDAQLHLNELALKSVGYEHQLRLAAPERKLDVHQAAYARWWKLQSKMYAEDAHDIAVDCQNWWVENNIFLDPKARDAFRDAYLAVSFMAQLKDARDPESVRDWRAHIETVRRAGNVIANAVALPSIQLKEGPEQPAPPERAPTQR